MLKLIDIKKDYFLSDNVVHALKGISISFRDNEFVSILGPSGCGKTTLLNIIGGLDHYTSGDMFIDDVSTKEYKDSDWDNYRNHRIGFIFQSYNLIPHQNILENVELALTISGIKKEERILKAKQALDKVGLKDMYYKKPNQLSGGQCQRVAIARALVNNPEILLADEPTGALDTDTSIQIMDLIKEISKDTLVIMVTHNPELAYKYSTRIVGIKDGVLISDSNPYIEEEIKQNEKLIVKKAKLSFIQAFKLSFRNLKSKLKRTLLVCFAGSIGIIGIATVLSVSTGVNNYIKSMQEDMLSGNPIRIDESYMDINSLLDMTSNSDQKNAIKNNYEDGYINVDSTIDFLVKRSDQMDSLTKSNNITSEYVQFVQNMDDNIYSSIVFDREINIKNNLYTKTDFLSEGENHVTSLSASESIYASLLKSTEYAKYAQLISAMSNKIALLNEEDEYILSQYDYVSSNSKYALDSDELLLVLDENGQISDLLLAQLGFYSQKEFFNILYKSINNPYDKELYDQSMKLSFDTIFNKEFYYFDNDYIFNKTSDELQSVNPFTYNPFMQDEFINSKINNNDHGVMKLKICGILKPKKGVSYGSLQSGLYYTKKFENMMIENNINSEISTFLSQDEYKENGYSSVYYAGNYLGITYKYPYQMYDDSEVKYDTSFVGSSSMFESLIGSMTSSTIPSTYTLKLSDVGGKELPTSIKIYPKNFKSKKRITSYLDTWNDKNISIDINGNVINNRIDINYTDNLAIIISLINNMITMVTSALIAFTALSLVVSTVMIAIITYVSVIERVKEIGVIRSLGGRKKDVSNLFNAETFIIGLTSGIIGIIITYVLSGIINLIVGGLSGIYTIATLPFNIALIMILISILLTLISGLIPASIAAKKDPVEALRSE